MTTLRKLLTICSITVSLAMTANERTMEEAFRIGESHIKLSQPKAVLTPASVPMTRSVSPSYFAFNVEDNKGYIIVSADDRFQDILGYSDSGSFDVALTNPSFEFWLKSISSEMESAMAGRSNISAKKASLHAVSAPDIAPLLTTKWGQWAPYNNDCKETGSLRPTIGWVPGPAPTGCVATAMAQVMRYHQWPPAYTNGSDTYQYNWDIMVESYDGSESAEAIDQVAKLMSHCGKAVNMKYTATESGASTFDIPNALVSKFGYDEESIRHIWRNSYGYDAIHEMLYNELKEGRPVITGGTYFSSSNSGHEFVLDGCNSDGFFHVNWGWGGISDGYFRLSAMQPSELDFNYSFDMDFIIGIKPQTNTDTSMHRPVITPFGDLQLAWTDDESVTAYCSMDDLRVTTVNSPYSGFINSGTSTFNRYNDKIICKFTDLSTGEVKTSYDEHFEFKHGSYYTEIAIRFYGLNLLNLKENTSYKFTLHYQLTNDNTLYDVEFGPGRRSYFIIERIGDQLKITQPKVESNISANFGNGSDRILHRNGQGFAVDFKNNSDTEYLGTVKCRVTDSYGNPVEALYSYIMLDLKPGESSSENFTLYNASQVEPGNYTMALYDYRDKLISDNISVELFDYKLEINAENFPDNAFREYISASFDSDRDGALSDQEIDAAYQFILDGVPVEDLTGIGHFTNLYYFTLIGGKMTHLDLSECPSLYSITVNSTPLETINISDNPNLAYLSLEETNIKSLDLSLGERLVYAGLSNNPLENLVLPVVSNLESLSCPLNALTHLDLTNQTKLSNLSYWSNKLNALDISGLENLTYLDASPNEITDFRMSAHPSLKSLNISSNLVEGTLDVAQSEALEELYVYDNKLTGISLGNHPNLQYIHADNNSISGSLDLSGYDKLTTIRLQNNNIDEIILGSHPNLTGINVSYNNLTGTVDLSKSNKLNWISVNDNQLTGIVLGQHPELTQLNVGYNQIEGTLDISGMPNIEELRASNNKFSVFKYDNHPNLWRVIIDKNALTHFHADDFPSLGSTYSCYAQEANISISTPNFNTKSLASTGFNPDRSSDWWAEWVDASGEKRYHECSTINGVVMIPDEAGRDVRLVYGYLVDAANNSYANFNINLTREGFESGVASITADDVFSLEANRLTFLNGIVGDVFTPSGMRVYHGSGITEPLSPGIYIIRQGSFSTKIMIP